MNEKIFYYGLLELGISIFIGVLTLYISYLIIDKLIRKKYEIEIENISYSIFCSGVLFSVAYLISGIKAPILNAVRMIQDQANYDGVIILDGLKYTGLFLIIIFLFNTFSIFYLVIFPGLKIDGFPVKSIIVDSRPIFDFPQSNITLIFFRISSTTGFKYFAGESPFRKSIA